MNAVKKKSNILRPSSLDKRPLSLRRYPDLVLREKAKPVQNIDGVIQKLTEDMRIFMKEHKGIGLAAPQVGILKEIFVADINGVPVYLINPKIVDQSGEEWMVESCLSFPNYSVEIKRNTCVTISGFTPDGKEVFLESKGLMARVFQHEMDHLNGVLIADYSPLKRSEK